MQKPVRFCWSGDEQRRRAACRAWRCRAGNAMAESVHCYGSPLKLRQFSSWAKEDGPQASATRAVTKPTRTRCYPVTHKITGVIAVQLLSCAVLLLITCRNGRAETATRARRHRLRPELRWGSREWDAVNCKNCPGRASEPEQPILPELACRCVSRIPPGELGAVQFTIQLTYPKITMPE